MQRRPRKAVGQSAIARAQLTWRALFHRRNNRGPKARIGVRGVSASLVVHQIKRRCWSSSTPPNHSSALKAARAHSPCLATGLGAGQAYVRA